MSQSTTLILLSETSYVDPGGGNVYTVTGNSTPAAAYYLGNRDLQTVNLKLSAVTGNIVIEASLATTPGIADWFTVYELEANASAVNGTPAQIASNASAYTNIEGNFVYMRAKIVDFAAGTLNFVKLSY